MLWLPTSRFASFETYKFQILAVEQERYAAAQYPPDVLRAGRRPLLQFPLETLEATMSNPGAIGIALRDRVSGRFVGYALGSALENHDEEGIGLDPRVGENNTFYLQAMATLPTVQNAVELENHLLESLRERATAAGFEFLSALIEDRLRDTGPAWFRGAAILERIDNYLSSAPGTHVVQSSRLDAHNHVVRYSWSVVDGGGRELIQGLDVAERARDGRLRRISMFHGPLPPN